MQPKPSDEAGDYEREGEEAPAGNGDEVDLSPDDEAALDHANDTVARQTGPVTIAVEGAEATVHRGAWSGDPDLAAAAETTDEFVREADNIPRDSDPDPDFTSATIVAEELGGVVLNQPGAVSP